MKSDTFYHIYNHANGSENLFRSNENYRYFLQQWTKYIEPIAGTYAYCLMPNHIHFLIRTHTEKQVTKNFNFSEELPFGKFETFQKVVSKQFSNLFSSYTQSFNKMYERRGSLFIPNFKRKEIDSEAYLTALVCYIHRNPIHHGFHTSLDVWKYSSYSAFLYNKPTKLQRDYILTWFNGKEDFIQFHKEQHLLNDTSLLIDF